MGVEQIVRVQPAPTGTRQEAPQGPPSGSPHLYGTVTQIPDLAGLRTPTTLPGAATDVVARKFKTELDDVQRQIGIVNENRDLFDAKAYKRYHDIIVTSSESLRQLAEKAGQPGGEQAFASKLAELTRTMRSLEDFIHYEKSQGLVATHAESGVRIYSDGARIWLCTPDRKAFEDYKASDAGMKKLQEYIKGLTGAEEIDLSKAFYQSEGNRNGRSLLGCQVVEIRITKQSDVYKVQTGIRTDRDLKAQEIQFSWKDILARAQQNNLPPGGPAALQGQNQNPVIPAEVFPGRAGTVEPPKPSPEDVRTQPPTAAVIPAVRAAVMPKPVPLSEQAAAAEAAAAARAKPAVPRAEEAAKGLKGGYDAAVKKAEAELAKRGTPEFDLPKAQAALKELDEAEKALGKQAKALEGELRAAPAQRTALQSQLREIEELRAQALIARKDLLREVMGREQPGSAAYKAAQRSLREMAPEVEAAYKLRIDRCADPAAKTALETQAAEFTKYSQSLDTLSKGRLSALLDAHPRVKGVVDWCRSLPGKEVPNPLAWAGRKWDQHQTIAYGKRADAASKLIDAKAASALTDAEAASQLGALRGECDAFGKRIKAVEERLRAGKVNPAEESRLAGELKSLQEIQAKAVLRRGEILERQIAGASGAHKLALQEQLYGELGQDFEAAQRAKDPAAADRFKAERDQFNADRAARERAEIYSRDPRVAKEAREAEAAQKEAAAAQDPLAKAQAEARQRAAEARREAAAKQVEIEELKAKKVPADQADAHKAQVAQAEEELKALQAKAKSAASELSQARLNRVSGDIAKIEEQLKTAPDADKPKLERRKARLEQERDALKQTLSGDEKAAALGEATLKSMAEQTQLAQAQKDLADKQAARKAIKDDPAAAAALDKEIADLQAKVNAAEKAVLDKELAEAAAARTKLQTQLADLEKRIAANPADAQLQAEKAVLEGRIKGMQQAEDYLTGRANVLSQRQALAAQEASLAEKQALRAAGTHPDPAVLDAEITNLQAQIKSGRASLTEAENAFKLKWNQRLAEATARFKANVIEGGQRWARENPAKAFLVVGMAAESVRGALMGNYEEEGRHTFVPTVLYMLNKDLRDWEFTTEKEGLTTSILAEATSSAGNVAVVGTTAVGTVKLAQWAAATRVGRPVVSAAAAVGNRTIVPVASRFAGTRFGSMVAGTAARVGTANALVGVGSFADGFLSFSDGAYINDNALQGTTRALSPLAMGAGFGFMVGGPPGAAIGFGAAYVGEAAGVAYSLYALDRDIANDWTKRGVRDSIRLAESGYLLPENHPLVRGRGPLNAQEQEVVNGMAKSALLGRLFHPQHGLSEADLQAMGFRTCGPNASQDEKQKVGQHNYERATELIEGRAGYNPKRWFVGSQIDQLRKVRPDLADKFTQFHNEARNHFTDLYRRSMRQTYHCDPAILWGKDEWSEGSESQDYIKGVAQEFAAKFGKEEKEAKTDEARDALAQREWEFMKQKFPQLEVILSQDPARVPFSRGWLITAFERANGMQWEGTAMMTNWQNSALGASIIPIVDPTKTISDTAQPIIDALQKTEVGLD